MSALLLLLIICIIWVYAGAWFVYVVFMGGVLSCISLKFGCLFLYMKRLVGLAAKYGSKSIANLYDVNLLLFCGLYINPVFEKMIESVFFWK